MANWLKGSGSALLCLIKCQFFISRITTSTGEDISGTRLGEKLFLRIEMDQESIFGIFARNLKAISGDNEDEIELLDSRGCPTDPIIFPGLQLLPNKRDLQGSFEAFKFSDTSIVRFQVNVQFCVEQCNPVQCGEGLESFGRRRREADVTTGSPITTKVPEPYASRLVFDRNLGQEVISGDSQLSKEIIVDSGTKIDSFRDPRSQEDLGVFVKGDYSEGEVVCTTWPVVIATGAAVVFLQLCILTTCILCLYTARRSKRPPSQVAMSDRQSLHRCVEYLLFLKSLSQPALTQWEELGDWRTTSAVHSLPRPAHIQTPCPS